MLYNTYSSTAGIITAFHTAPPDHPTL